MNLALKGLVEQCVVGKTPLELCEFGHLLLTSQAAKLYTKKVNGELMDRGVAFPVSISVNEVVCNHSPLSASEQVSQTMISILLGLEAIFPCTRTSSCLVNTSMPRLLAGDIFYGCLFCLFDMASFDWTADYLF